MLELGPLITRVLRTKNKSQSAWVQPDYFHQCWVKIGTYTMCSRYVEVVKPLFF